MVYVAKIRIFLSLLKKLTLFLTIFKTPRSSLSNKYIFLICYDFINGFDTALKKILCAPINQKFYCINHNYKNKKAGKKPAYKNLF